VATTYVRELRRLHARELLDEHANDEVRTARMLAAILLTEFYESYRDQLDAWFYGIDEGDNFFFLFADFMTDALQTFTSSLEGRLKAQLSAAA
jgi:hypothetical protein